MAIFDEENRPESKIEERLFQKASLEKIPLSGTLELSPVCNMACDMCYARLTSEQVRSQGGLLEPSRWISVAEQLQTLGCTFLLLTGGEPFLYPGFMEVYEYLSSRGFVLTINSNGTLIDEKWASFLSLHRPRRVNITLYGIDENGYENLCHYRNGFERALEAIRLLRAFHVDVKLNVSLTPKNLPYLEQFYELAASLNLPMEIDSYMFPFCRGDGTFPSESRLNAAQCAEAQLNILRRENPQGFAAYIRDARLYQQGMNLPNHDRMTCRAGKSSFWINWKGEMTPCFAMKQNPVSVITEGVSSAWQKTAAYVDQLRLSSKCSACPRQQLCISCAGKSECETGEPSGCPEYLCQVMDYLVG